MDWLYNVTLKRNTNNDPITRAAEVNAKKVLTDTGWHIPHFSPSLENQQIMMDQLLNKDPTDM